jgi:BirA family biotin operon repressor/biotin-[acetyl-CoA-carboxylase] ligase
MTPPTEWHLDSHHIGRRVLVFDQLESTNTHAASLANDSRNNGLVILANEQTAGRGQHGRSWLCGAGAGVLLSVLLFPPEPLRRPAILTAWAAVSVCEAIRRLTGLQAKIKWPNDVLIRGRKVCGILIEQARGTVVGVGLNVNQTAEDFARAELPEAGSLSLFSDTALDCQQTTRALIEQLDEEYERLLQGDFATLEACWKWRIGLLGKPVIAECADGTYRGRLREVGWEGVELELSTGDVLRLLPERVQHLMPG